MESRVLWFVLPLSLVATVKIRPILNDSLVRKAVKFLESVSDSARSSAIAFLSNRERTTAESSTDFVQSIVVLLSIPSQPIATATMKMLGNMIVGCSAEVRLALVTADLITQIILTLNPLTFSFTEAADIHINLMESINWTVWLITPDGLSRLRIQNHDGRQAVYETVFKQVLTLSEKYIWHLCVNRISMADDKFSYFLTSVLARLLEVCPYHQPTMEFVLHMPVILTIPSCLTFFEIDNSIWYFLDNMNHTQQKWNKTRGAVRHMWKTVHRRLRMEGIEDVIEVKLQNDRNGDFGGWIVSYSIEWNNLLGMNLLKQE
ncbi:hypothetical protein BLNAU_12040 [Blattamonas nauphoetae]|uniref:Uncharacterized protein n=1 Tax=Blattamonas nauphoetae TaxID=2049346 RepID=A0ABQ9XRJ6_9EUKA|nr:hypothetical protein BLNAU_12040 [Blattamonas nauphoetae]